MQNAMALMAEIIVEVDLWFLSQQIDKELEVIVEPDTLVRAKRWRPPPEQMLKCNVGCYWNKDSHMGGMAWVLRDWKGLVLLHSRRSFSNVGSRLECNFIGLLWAIQSLQSHGVSEVVLATEDSMIAKFLERPKAWPSFKLQASEAALSLANFRSWKVLLEPRCANRGAFLIAQSVIKGDRRHSYVAVGHPSWLDDIFISERVSPSV